MGGAGEGQASRIGCSWRPAWATAAAAKGPNTFDMVAALEQWVEQGKAPDQILASRVDRRTGRSHAAALPVSAGRDLQGNRQHRRSGKLRVPGRRRREAWREWVVPRMPDGHPDLQGIWTTHTFTPLVRPARYADQEFLTEQEAAELAALLSQDEVDPLAAGIFGASDEERRKRVVQNDPTHYDNALWLATPDLKPLSSNRTSLIYDPPDGKIPPVTPDARERAAARRAAISFDSHENRPLQERCIMWTHEGPPMLPPPYNDVLQIIQTPDHVLVVQGARHRAASDPDRRASARL